MQHELEPQYGKMYAVSYLIDNKDPGMYSRHPSLNLNHQNFVPTPPQYSDFTGYHHVPGINNDPHHSQAGTWSPAYPPPREEWPTYGPGSAASTSNPGQISFTPTEFSPVQPPSLLPPINTSVGQLSPNSQRRNPYDWMRRSAPPTNPGSFLTPSPFYGYVDISTCCDVTMLTIGQKQLVCVFIFLLVWQITSVG